MNESLAEKVSPRSLFLFVGAAVGAAATARYVATRRITAADRFAECLLDTRALNEGLGRLDESSASVLAACASYTSGVAYHASRGIGLGTGPDDPIGASRTHTHPFTGATATVRTEAVEPNRVLTYAVEIPNIGEVRGSRHVGPLKLQNLCPARSTPDVVQLTLGGAYSAQIVTEFYTAERLMAGRDRLYGAATLHDNFGNVGRLNIAFDGTLLGTITCNNRVVGRFAGNVSKGIEFRPNQIPT